MLTHGADTNIKDEFLNPFEDVDWLQLKHKKKLSSICLQMYIVLVIQY